MYSRFYSTLDSVIRTRLRLEWLPAEFHAGFGQRFTALAVIARAAGRDQIQPGVLPAS
jgi:hypothetical protein